MSEGQLAAPQLPSGGKPRVLIVDDQRIMRTTTAFVLQQAGYDVAGAESGEAALARLLAEPFEVVLTDLKMAPLDGIAVLRGALEIAPATQVIVMTGYGTVESAVAAMQQGAHDYVSKPFKQEELLVRVQRALEKRRLLVEVGLYADEFRQRYKLDALVGRSAAMRELLTRVVRVAPTEGTVLITGESGTGKAIAEKRFREDLFYRLNVVPLVVPPLRERRDDIPILAQHFVGRFNQRNSTRRVLTQGALQKMVAHGFPGNVRELENVVEQAAALSHSDEITADDVRLESLTDSGPPAVRTLAEQIDEAEREAIQRSMARADGNLERV